MKRIKFRAKPYKVGNSHVITIPSEYINNKLLDKNKTRWWIIGEETTK